MMKIDFCGVGEAFDEYHTNTSILVTLPKPPLRQILLDCGFSAAPSFWRNSPDPLELDAVWVSHFHGDHFFGIPQLLLRMFEHHRQKPLTVIGQIGVRQIILDAMEMAYPGFLEKMAFPLETIEMETGLSFETAGFKGTVAPSIHSKPCLALRLDHTSSSVFYSGDGRPSEDSRQLAQGCDLIIQEAFTVDETLHGHATITGAIEFAQNAGARYLALVHLNRDVRQQEMDRIKYLIENSSPLTVLLPQSGDTLELIEKLIQ